MLKRKLGLLWDHKLLFCAGIYTLCLRARIMLAPLTNYCNTIVHPRGVDCATPPAGTACTSSSSSRGWTGCWRAPTPCRSGQSIFHGVSWLCDPAGGPLVLAQSSSRKGWMGRVQNKKSYRSVRETFSFSLCWSKANSLFLAAYLVSFLPESFCPFSFGLPIDFANLGTRFCLRG